MKTEKKVRDPRDESKGRDARKTRDVMARDHEGDVSEPEFRDIADKEGTDRKSPDFAHRANALLDQLDAAKDTLRVEFNRKCNVRFGFAYAVYVAGTKIRIGIVNAHGEKWARFEGLFDAEMGDTARYFLGRVKQMLIDPKTNCYSQFRPDVEDVEPEFLASLLKDVAAHALATGRIGKKGLAKA